MSKSNKNILSSEESVNLIQILKIRFENNRTRHKELIWDKIEIKLQNNPTKLWSINEMEITGGEPDVVNYDNNTDEYHIVDCATESPKGRRSYCYDHKALDARKENKPKNSAENVAKEMGVELLTEEQYRQLQDLEKIDLKTSSWVKTPEDIRALGGAIFCDRRYNTVFTYHNGAESYYAARAFRALVKL